MRFQRDRMLQFAVIHALQIIGEAAFKVSQPFQRNHPEIPWTAIAGFRHRVVHDYFKVQWDIVWQIAASELQPLIDSLRPLIPPLPPDAQFDSSPAPL